MNYIRSSELTCVSAVTQVNEDHMNFSIEMVNIAMMEMFALLYVEAFTSEPNP